MALPSQVRILPPPPKAASRHPESPKDVRFARARIWGKGQMTIPAGPRKAAGFKVGDALYVEARDEGTLIVTRVPTP
jgi:hypothetical protein